MKVVIAGGSGLIGRELTRRLVADGIEVAILSRHPERVSGLPPMAVAVRWDGVSAGALAPRLEGASAVVNLAGENIAAGRWSAARKRRIWTSRVRTASAMATALERVDRRPAVFLQASAVGIYGPRGDSTVTESDPPGRDFLAQVCRDWEAASAGVENFGVREVVVRTGVVLTDRGGALPRIAVPFKLFVGGRLGSGKQWLPWIHIKDEVRAIRFLLERQDASGPFNLTAPNPVTNSDMAATIGRTLGRPSLIPTPAQALRIAMGEMATLVLDGQRAIPRRLVKHGFQFRFEQFEPAVRDLLT